MSKPQEGRKPCNAPSKVARVKREGSAASVADATATNMLRFAVGAALSCVLAAALSTAPRVSYVKKERPTPEPPNVVACRGT